MTLRGYLQGLVRDGQATLAESRLARWQAALVEMKAYGSRGELVMLTSLLEGLGDSGIKLETVSYQEMIYQVSTWCLTNSARLDYMCTECIDQNPGQDPLMHINFSLWHDATESRYEFTLVSHPGYELFDVKQIEVQLKSLSERIQNVGTVTQEG